MLAAAVIDMVHSFQYIPYVKPNDMNITVYQVVPVSFPNT